jgi:hypothetical protein
VLGWDRFDAAADWLKAHPTSETRICKTSGSSCQCPSVPSPSNTCEEQFRQDSKAQGLQIPDVNLPIVRPMFEAWKRQHPNC